MGQSELEDKIRQTVKEALGYLNLSSGAPDARFQRDLNELFGWVAQRSKEYGTPWHGIARLLRDELALLRGSSSAFADVAQAEAVIDLAFEKTLVEYRVFYFLFTPKELHNIAQGKLWRRSRRAPPWVTEPNNRQP